MNHRTEDLTLWRMTGQDVYNKTTFASPVLIEARYQEKDEVIVDSTGRDVVSSTQIFTETELKVGDYVVLGISADLTPTDDARQLVRVNQLRFVTNNADVYKGML